MGIEIHKFPSDIDPETDEISDEATPLKNSYKGKLKSLKLQEAGATCYVYNEWDHGYTLISFGTSTVY